MVLKRLAFAVAAGSLAATSAWAGEELLFGPPPEWVEAPAPADDPNGDNTLPARVVLMDTQTRFAGGDQSVYSAVRLKFQTPQGLAGGNLSFAWRPETQDVTVHQVLIRRGDETIDVLESGQTFSVLRREQNLEQAMLDGTLTATMFPEDLQVGDVLEFASTVVTRDPVLAGHNEIAIGPLNFPIDRAEIRLQWPAGRSVKLAKTDDLPGWRRSRKDGFESVALTLENVEPLALPRLAPLRYGMVRFIEATDYASWADVATLQIPLYEKAARISAQGPLRNEVERIRESSDDPVARAEAALRLVQSRVRYVALAMGEGGLVPTDAETTWSRRYGDCKAKTALLLAILGELGIDAEGVAVHTVLGDAVAQRVPSIGAFDHILVRARIGGRDYWLDGTRTGDNNLARLQVPDFAWGLPIVPGAELVRVVPAPLDEPHADLAIHMDAREGVRGPVPTRIELTLRGDAAIGTNEAFANFVGEARDRALREYWRRRFDFVEPERVTLAYDDQALEAQLVLEGPATMKWDGVWYRTNETGLGYRADFSREAGPGRDAPFAVSHPFYTRTRQTIVLPPGFSAPSSNDLNVEEVVAGVEYRRSTRFAENTLFIEAAERSIANEFEAKDAPAYQSRLRQMADNAIHLRMPGGNSLTAVDAAAMLDVEPTSAQGFIDQAVMLMDQGKYPEAIERLIRASALAPENAWAWANRALSLAHLDRLAEAEEAIDRAAALDPAVWVTYNARGILAEKRRDYPAAITAFSRVIELEPRNTFAWARRAMAHAASNQPERALSDASEAIRIAPSYAEMYALRVFTLLNSGKPDEARREIETMLAANPDHPAAISAAGSFYVMLGEPAKARELVERAVESAPTPMAFFERARLREPSDTSGRISDLDAALRLAPDFHMALAARATLHAETGDVDGALTDAAEAIRLGSQQRELYVLRANLARSNGRRDEAIAAAKGLIDAHPGSTPALVDAARIYSSLEMYGEAVESVDRALELAPEPYLYLDRSRARDPADFEGRMADVEQALRRSPNYDAGLAARAGLLAEKGDHAGAVRSFGQAIALSSNPALLIERGISLTRLGRTREAERDFAQARQRAQDAATLNNICYMKAVADVALERALEECEESLKLRPDFAPTLDSRGAVLLRLGRLDEAIRDFDRVLEQMPSLAQSRYLRAVARSQKGDAAGAQADLGAVRRDNPTLVESMERDGFVVAPVSAAAAAS